MRWKHSTIEPTNIPTGSWGDYGYVHARTFPRAYYTQYWNSVLYTRKDDPVGPSTPFDHSVDPKGILASIVDDKYFYGSDNVVQYYSAQRKLPDDVMKWVLHVDKQCYVILTHFNQIQKSRSCNIQNRRHSRSSNNSNGSSCLERPH